MDKNVLFILGTAHSGSTLLSLMLGSHSKCFAVGELSNLPEFYRKGMSLSDLSNGGGSFWEENFSNNELKALSATLSNQRLRPYMPLKVEKFLRSIIGADHVFRPYTQIFSKLPREVNTLIDSTKTIDWISQELALPEFTSKALQPKLIHLVRDGRAVMASYLRRLPDLSVEEFCDIWERRTLEARHFFDQFPQSSRKLVRYEYLATRSEETLKELCVFLEIPFLPEMVEYWRKDHHIISGNKGTKSLIKAYQSTTDAPRNAEQKFGIKLDLRWQQELSSEQLSIFQKRVGELNHPYIFEGVNP